MAPNDSYDEHGAGSVMIVVVVVVIDAVVIGTAAVIVVAVPARRWTDAARAPPTVLDQHPRRNYSACEQPTVYRRGLGSQQQQS